MDNLSLKIAASCIISNNQVFKDGKLLYEAGKTKNVNEFFTDLYNFLLPDYPKFYKMDHLAKLGWLACEVLLKGSFDKAAYAPEDTGIVLSNSNSSLDNDRRYYKTVNEYPSPSLFVYTLPNIVIGEICIRNQFRGENAFFVFESFQPEFIAQYAGSLLKNGQVKNCICGWVEVLENKYSAILYLVQQGEGLVFNQENMLNLSAQFL